MDSYTNRKPLIVLTGPTAVGKTALSLKLAGLVNGEIVSADSMQVYQKMNIGTAKLLPSQMGGIRHHLIDVLDPRGEFNVCLFKEMAEAAISEIYARGRIPILVGGTGFYIQAILKDVAFEETEVSSYRRGLEEIAGQPDGAHRLHEMLKEIDVVSYDKIHENNVKRTIRALEFYHDTGYPISRHNEEQGQKESPYNYAYFVLTHDREVLYRRIEERIDGMISEGLVEEVASLLDYGCTADMVSMQGLGYKEIIPYLSGECELADAVNILKRDTRHFAKRQLTWFRREADVIWFDKSCYASEEEILSEMQAILKERGIIEE